MKIRVYSDLHIDPSYFLPYTPPVLPDEDQQVLILAGDVAEYKHVAQFVLDMSKRFRHVIYIFGNHEFYKTSISRAFEKVKGKIAQLNGNRYPTNVSILENEFVIIDDVAFIGATLWSSMDERHPFTMWNAKQRMNDYRQIRMPVGNGKGQNAYGSKLTPTKTVEMHYESRQYFMETSKKLKADLGVRKIVAISHHGPTKQSIDPGYVGDGLNGAYVSELTEELYAAPIDLWCHGHVHHKFDYTVTFGHGDEYPTRVVTNPRGYRMKKYPNQMENPDFEEEALIEL